jgi:UDP-N-acetylmuramyl pentapeptide phosphotransferase/UDP-N-acetylglucosamine-1-phosphate transferase
MSWRLDLCAFALTLPTAWTTVGHVRRWLERRQILDHPNERSSHLQPTPRGGGLAVTPVVLLGWLVLVGIGAAAPGSFVVMVAAALLLALSWRDDRVGLSARTRLIVQALAVTAGLWAMPAGQSLFHGGLPVWADRTLAGLAWLWFLNLYNFMDGIDGMTGVETACLAAGLMLVSDAAPQAAVLGAAALAFLAWNWSPARIFLGDAGSIPLGYLTGWLLLRLADQGHLAAALILPAFYLADASLTLTRRALRREPVWQAHRQHFYQRAAAVVGHARVSATILAADLGLIALALWSMTWPVPALAAAAALTAGLLWRLSRMAGG